MEIPLKIWQTWSTKILPPRMLETVEKLKMENPEFEYNLFDDEDCAYFIKKYFPIEVYETFNALVPGAFKADLWRYCVLYIHGGIYLDIKFRSMSKFKLKELVRKEHFAMDRITEKVWLENNFGIYNAIMVCAKGNRLLLNCIKNIVYQYKNNLYNYNTLYISGPGLLGYLFSITYPLSMTEEIIDLSNVNSDFVFYNGVAIFRHYEGYREDQEKLKDYRTYGEIWHRRKVYFSPVEIEYSPVLLYLEKYKECEKILKIDVNDYLSKSLDYFPAFFPKAKNIYGYTELTNFKHDNIEMFDNFELLYNSVSSLNLIIDNSHDRKNFKTSCFIQLFFEKLARGGCYIVMNYMTDFFFDLNKQVLERKPVDTCPFNLGQTTQISSITFHESRHVIICKK